MTRSVSARFISRRISFGGLRMALGIIIIRHFQLISSWESTALQDAPPLADGEPDVKELGTTNWIIIRKKMAWGEASIYCEKKYFRLAVLPTKDDAVALVKEIVGASEPFTPKYLEKYKESEFGMDRRYWIGLTDQMQDGTWTWARDGSVVAYEFWYPNQPDHMKLDPSAKSLEHCVTLWNPGFHNKTENTHSFNDEDCAGKYYFICDKAADSGTVPLSSTPPPGR